MALYRAVFVDRSTSRTIIEMNIAASSPESVVRADTRWVIFSLVLTVAGSLLAWLLYTWIRPTPFDPRDGVGAFALLYVLAQVLERLYELFDPWVGKIGSTKDINNSGRRIGKAEALKTRDEAVVQARLNAGGGEAAEKAARAQQVVDQIRENRIVAVWGVMSFLALIASGALGCLLVRAVASTDVPSFLDILITGLVIGGGTKPLHDLIVNISKSKNSKEDPLETQP